MFLLYQQSGDGRREPPRPLKDDVLNCQELPDGLVMWEDDVLHHGEHTGWGSAWFKKSKWLIDQIVFSRHHRPALTHYIGTVQKKDWSLRAAKPSP